MEAASGQVLPVDSALSRGLTGPSISDCIVVVPTYNERENIAPLITALKALSEPVDILVVDDGSPDGTGDIVRSLIQRHEGVYLLQRSGKGGLGSAYKAGFAFALRHGWEYICQMDADFSHDPKDILRLLTSCRNGAEVAIGSRYVKGGRISGWPWRRHLLSRTANLYAQMLTRCRISDLTGGFKCFTRKALQKIDLGQVGSEGYIFQVEMNYRATIVGLKVEQLPICFSDRTQGTSKMGSAEAREGLIQVLRLVWDQNGFPRKMRLYGNYKMFRSQKA
ncbi:MAG: polyprenol monophosphomannose synthase [Planctomycetes bacterium]|nr:polyprenol monophosphomannose synthase [Planctomycetota bacterium]